MVPTLAPLSRPIQGWLHMKTQYYTATSLDGFIADENHSLDWLFDAAEGAGSSYEAFIADVGAVAMGSTTYAWVVSALRAESSDGSVSWPYQDGTWVFSSRPQEPLPGADVRFVSGDVRPVHAAMVEAAGGKNIWIAGGGDLVGQFHDAGLLDEIIVQIAPVTLGVGAPLLPRRIAIPGMTPTAVERYGRMVEVRYDVPKG